MRANDPSVSNLFLTIGGLADQRKPGDPPTLLANQLAAAIERSLPDPNSVAQPPPPDILAMMRLCEFFCRTEGDVWQTIAVPAEILLKDVGVECADDGAKKVWEELWKYDRPLDINHLYEQAFLGVEKAGQFFPLEIWDTEGQGPTQVQKDILGIAAVEPTSMWVGQHIVTPFGSPYSIASSDAFPIEKLRAQIHPLAYSSFVTDLNVQTTSLQRIEIRQDSMTPIFGFKMDYERYAVPHIARASRNILHRQVLEEYRRGTIEQFLAQILLISVGTPQWPATPQKVKKVTAMAHQAVTNRTGVLVVDHAVTAEILAPKPLDQMLGNQVYSELTQMILRDLGFSLFLISGEVPGSSGRGGTQVELDVQLAIERWEKRRTRFIDWAMKLSAKVAKARGDAALLKYPPQFVPTEIGVKQTQAIKEKILPLYQSGLLSRTSALKASGSNYDQQLKEKKQEEPNKEYFLPTPTFNQTAVGADGERTDALSSPRGKGRPSGTSNDAKGALDPGMAIEGRLTLRSAIDSRYAQVVSGELAPVDFGTWLESSLTNDLYQAFQDGWMQAGGLGEPDYQAFANSPQGLNFHLAHARQFALDVGGSSTPVLLRPRALSYAGAANTAFVLGTQQAMASHGARNWQRVLHPELSMSGPCAECEADAQVVHGIEEPFTEFHPHGVCSAQSVLFGFNQNTRARSIPVPEWGFPTRQTTRPHPVESSLALAASAPPAPALPNITIVQPPQTINVEAAQPAPITIQVPAAPSPNVTVQAHNYVEPTPVHVDNRTIVNPTPITVEAKNQVNVAPTPIEAHIQVEPTPVNIQNEQHIQVEPTPVTIENSVSVPAPERVVEELVVRRDRNGEIASVVKNYPKAN